MKKICAFLLAAILLFSISVSVLAIDDGDYYYDYDEDGVATLYVPCTASDEDIAALASALDLGECAVVLLHNIISPDNDYDDPICYDCGEQFSEGYEETPSEVSVLPFTDVPADSWYYSYVSIAHDFGILNGKSDTAFDPDASMTVAEAIKIAACINITQNGEEPSLLQPYGDKWYSVYVDYCYDKNIIEDYIVLDYDKTASRGEMAYLFSRADSYHHTINEIPLTDIPDVHDSTPYAYEILDLYDKGVAVGSDSLMTFHPDSNIKRSEAAALIARILCYDLRIKLADG